MWTGIRVGMVIHRFFFLRILVCITYSKNTDVIIRKVCKNGIHNVHYRVFIFN